MAQSECNEPGCNAIFNLKNKTNYRINYHSKVVRNKEGTLIGLRLDLDSPFLCTFCLVNGLRAEKKTNKNMLSHAKQHHFGEVITRNEIEIVALLQESHSLFFLSSIG